MSLSEDFVSKVCNAFKKAVESASGVTLEGREREFRHALARYLFDEILGWEGYSKVGEIYDITCFDDENFPIIVVETKWGVEPSHEIKEKLRKRIEELGSVKYGVFASERDFIVYEYRNYALKDIIEVNVPETIWAAKEGGLSETVKKNILKLETLNKDRLVGLEKPEYFERKYKEISVAKGEGVKLLTDNLKDIVNDLTTVLMNFFDSYKNRKNHYSSRFLENTFKDWLKISMKDEEFKGGNESKRKEIVQIFCRETAYVLLGRLLFTRICEDKDIIETMVSGRGVAESLKYYGKRGIENAYLRLFNESREEIRKYYSHLHELGFFDWWIIEEVKKGTLVYDDKKIQDDLEKDLDYSIKKALKRLNRFDFSNVNRDILGDVYQGYLPSDERKRLGEFYTPKEVIEYILDTVGYIPENEIRGKKILDPSCGSGSFLVEATHRLIERYEKIGSNLKDPDDAKQIIDECIKSIYGLDIHPFACFIAEMNILFQLVDLYDIVRQKEKYYELPRVKVYPTDSLIPPEPMELAEFFENSRRKMLIEETKGANRVKGINFDFVVGNPPYVRKERIRTEYKEKVLAKAYSEVYNGDNDIYVYFVTKGIGWLNESGKLGYIVSGKFTKTRYGEKLRKFILDTCCVEHFLDLRGVKVFREATNDPIILILAKEPSAEKRQVQQIKVVEVKKEDENTRKLMERIKKELNKEIFSDDYLDVFQTSQSLLTKEVWKIVKGKYYELLDKIKSSSNYLLDSLCRITRGIETGRNVSKNGEPVFVFDNERALPSNLERSLLKPLVKGEDMVRWVAIHKGRWIIYDADIEDENYFKSNYPNVYQHLFKFYNELVYKHKNGKDSHPEGRGSQLMKQRIWYELRKPLDREMLENEKILTRRITNEHLFAYDNEKLYPLETCCIIVPKNEHRDVNQIKYITGLLNSKIIEFYLKLTSRHLGKKGYEYEKQYLERLPIKLPQTEEEKEVADKIISKVDQILQLKKEACLLSKRVGEFPDSYFVDSWTFSKLLNAVKSQNLSFSSYAISEKLLRTDYRQRDLDGSETFRIILSTSEFIDFYSEEVASYVLGVLKNINRITKRELLELKIPQQPYLKNLLNQYRKDKEQIVKNEEAVEELEKQIDDIVYKLYDITYPERKIIENYLKKF